MHASATTFPSPQRHCNLQRSGESKVVRDDHHFQESPSGELRADVHSLMDWYGLCLAIFLMQLGIRVLIQGIIETWKIIFFLINIFSKNRILMEMTIYKWRCSSWGLSQWSLRICSNWHCFNLYFPHSPVLAHELISLSYIHWTSNSYGSVHFFILIFRSSGFLRQLFFWFPPVFPDAMWSLKRISQCLTFHV